MSIKQKQLMEYATQDLVAMVAEREGLSIQDAMGVVYHSRLHEKLHDVETGLYLVSRKHTFRTIISHLIPAASSIAICDVQRACDRRWQNGRVRADMRRWTRDEPNVRR